jgi:hypothetical protein
VIGGEQPAIQETGGFVVAMIVPGIGKVNVCVAYFSGHSAVPC